MGAPGAPGVARGAGGRGGGAGGRGRVHGIGRRGLGDGSRFSFVLSFVDFLGRIYSFLGQARVQGKGELATSRQRADCRQENWAKCTLP